MKFDRFDRKILNILQKDGRLSNTDLAKHVGLSPSACLRRLNALSESGLIKRFCAILDHNKVGFHGTAFLSIKLERQSREDLDTFEAAVVKIPEIVECHLLTGEVDYMLKLTFRDSQDFERIHSEKITKLPGVRRVVTLTTLRCVHSTTALPL